MKIAILSDIHGNRSALDAVLQHARGQGANETIINLGDSVGYGPDPEAIVRWSKSAKVINLLGDYDKKVLAKKFRKTGWAQVKNPDKRAMFAWTYYALSKSSRKILKSYPKQRDLSLAGLQILCTHTGPGPHRQYLSPETPDAQLSEIAKQAPVDIILCGHSHQAFIRWVADVLFINPGSVGRLDDGDPRASYAVLELVGNKAEAQLYRVPYNLVPVVKAIRQSGLGEVFAQVIQQGLSYDNVVAQFGESMPSPRIEPNGILTFLLDYERSDPQVGIMKGVVLNIAPQSKIVELCHPVSERGLEQVARWLADTVFYFAPGTVHVAMVDPQQDAEQRLLAARVGSNFFLAPDNGLLTFVIKNARNEGKNVEIYQLDNPLYWLPNARLSSFRRDILAPVAAHLVNGIPIDKLGTLVSNPNHLD
jgi:putative phosphoesterase